MRSASKWSPYPKPSILVLYDAGFSVSENLRDESWVRLVGGLALLVALLVPDPWQTFHWLALLKDSDRGLRNAGVAALITESIRAG